MDGTASAIMIDDDSRDHIGKHESKSKEQLFEEKKRLTQGSNYQSNQNEPPCKCK